MIEYICGLFPHVAGVPSSAPPLRALFESFFAPVTPAMPSLNFNWFDRVRTALKDDDTRVAGLLAAGLPERLLLPQRLASYVVRGECSFGRAVPVSESLLAHFDCPLRPNLQLGITVRDAMVREASFLAQSEALSYSMWVLSGLLGLCACRASPQLILRSLSSSLPLFPRAWPIRLRFPPLTPLFSAVVAKSFTSVTFRRILVMLPRGQCCPLLRFLRTRFSGKRMVHACWRPLGPPPP